MVWRKAKLLVRWVCGFVHHCYLTSALLEEKWLQRCPVPSNCPVRCRTDLYYLSDQCVDVTELSFIDSLCSPISLLSLLNVAKSFDFTGLSYAVVRFSVLSLPISRAIFLILVKSDGRSFSVCVVQRQSGTLTALLANVNNLLLDSSPLKKNHDKYIIQAQTWRQYPTGNSDAHHCLYYGNTISILFCSSFHSFF